MSEIKIGGHCPKCQQPIALCYCEKKFALREINEYIQAGRRMDKSLSDKIEEALKGSEK